MFSKQDLQQIKKHGLTVKQVEHQIQQFKEGFPYLELIKPGIAGDGIKKFSDDEKKKYVDLYDQRKDKFRFVKFVPASGAATRMFKSLFDVINNYKGTESEYLAIISDRNFPSLYYFFEHLADFAFYDDLLVKLKENNTDIEQLTKKRDFITVLKTILNENGLNYANMPKGLIKFHQCKNEHRTPVEEHFLEGIQYCNQKNVVRLHFTVSPEHRKMFKKHIEVLIKRYEKEFKISISVDLSEQSPSTDTIAVDNDNNLFRDKDGNLVFRPGGHGALIENLGTLDTDFVFIKNIDNVVQERLKADTIFYKKMLAGMIIDLQDKVFAHIRNLKKTSKPNKALIDNIAEFVEKELCVVPPDEFAKMDLKGKKEYLLQKLDRPIRVCGMVRNEGEPGGGPYWAKNSDGSVSLQIVESSQFNPGSASQKKIVEQATHFNPVDIVCSLRNYRKSKFKLDKFIDHSTGFISCKSKDGKELKALELPGLWNGAMSKWNTVFVEVPITTFNPVKTIHDLLRKEHLNEYQLLSGRELPPNILI